MKRARSWQYLWRLTKWRDLYLDLARQPWIEFFEEITVEEAKRWYGYQAPENSIGVKIGYEVYAPMEVEVEP